MKETKDLAFSDRRSPDSSEGTAAHLDLALAASDIGVWELEIATHVATRNLRHDQIFGYPEGVDAWNFERFIEHVDPDDRERVSGMMEGAVASGERWKFTTKITRADGSAGWITASGMPVRDADGTVTRLIGHVIDVSEIKRDEERLRLYAAELGHRVGNTLAMISAMIRLSARTASSVPEFATTTEGRLAALSRINRLLIGQNALAVTPSVLLEAELGVHGQVAPRVTAAGLDLVELSSKTAEGLSLVLHELLDNAMRHGALSVAEGRVEITGTREGDRFEIVWQERGGPGPAGAMDKGFGTMVLNSALRPHGRIDRQFTPDGMRCVISLDREAAYGSPGPLHTPRDDLPAAQMPGTAPAGTQASPPREVQPSSEVIEPTAADPRPVVLVVEDEPLISMDLGDMIQSLGCGLAGPAARVVDALDLAETDLAAALLDINLVDGTSVAVAERLRERGIPYAVISGRAACGNLTGPGTRYGDAPLLVKPVVADEVTAVLKTLLAGRYIPAGLPRPHGDR